MFEHDDTYTTVRHSLGLQSPGSSGEYIPGCSMILIGKGSEAQHQSPFTVQHHELAHCHQMFSTSTGLLITSLLALRNIYVQQHISKVNADFGSGLWVPILGWLRDIDPNNYDGWWDPGQSYYWISALKRNVGVVDSVLFALGAIESNNMEDRRYWLNRFPWEALYPYENWESAFGRQHVRGGLSPVGVYSLLEASLLYREVLSRYETIERTNELFMAILQGLRTQLGESALWQSIQIITYYGPFLECDRLMGQKSHLFRSKKVPPYHLIPILAFWALNTPLPQVSVDKSILGRANPKQYSWTQVCPSDVFYDLFNEQKNNARLLSAKKSGIDDLPELAKLVRPAMEQRFGHSFMEDLIQDDLSYIEKVTTSESARFSLALSALNPSTSLDERLNGFFSFPPSLKAVKELVIVSENDLPEVFEENLRAYLVRQVAEHLIPIWSFGSLPRFRLGKPFVCPSTQAPLDRLCPIPGKCPGEFPGTRNLPPSCWLQSYLQKEFQLPVDRIGIVPGEYGSEEEAIQHRWAGSFSSEAELSREKIAKIVEEATRTMKQSPESPLSRPTTQTLSAKDEKKYLALARTILTTRGERFKSEIVKRHKKGEINSGFCQFLEDCALGKHQTSIEPYLLAALLQEIKSTVYVPPHIAENLYKFYLERINQALNPPQAIAVENLLDELKEKGLLTREFAELFLHALNDAAREHGALLAQTYWEMCRETLDPEILAEVDHWLG